MSLQVCIMTPDQIFWDDVAEEIILPTNTGQMGVLSRHTSLITALDIGVMSIRAGGSWFALALMNGFALIQNDRVTVLVNGAEDKWGIDLEEARRAFDDAEAEVKRADDKKMSVEAALAFKRARTRLVVASGAGASPI